ncbi:MAG TPA: AsmA-like C-terminal domain-containing protein [Candidatus Binatia bacterium]|nr:AsmA-like C-terminal domain-containing protein [Candidatus Binatia bacterium]
MKRFVTLAGYLGAALILFSIVLSLAFYHLARTGDFRRYLLNAIEQQTSLKVQLGNADLEIGPVLGVSFGDVILAESDLASPALRAERVTARVAFWPLLNRQLVFYELRVKSPDVRLTRDREGEFPLLARLLNFPFFKQDHAQFKLDLRTLRISGGKFELIDRSAEGPPITTRLHDVALVLERERAAVVQQAWRHWVKSTPKEPQGPALNVDISAAVERQDHRADWRAQGKVVFPDGKIDLMQAWCDLQMRISGTAAALAGMSGKQQLGFQNLSGVLDSRFRIQGTLRHRLDATGTLDIGSLSVDAPELFATPLNVGDGRLLLAIQIQPELWTVSRADYRSEELNLAINGEVRPTADGDVRLQLNFSTKPLPLGVFKKYFPLHWLEPSPPATLLHALTEGELVFHNAGVNATLAEIRHMVKTGIDERLWFEAELRNGVASFSGYPPLRALKGNLVLEKSRVAFHSISGTAGQTHVAELNGNYDLSAGGLQLRARGVADLGELREHAQRGILPPEVTRAFLSVESLGGKSKFEVGLTQLPNGARRAEGNLTLEKAQLHWGTHVVSEIDGDLAFTPTEIKGENVRAVIHGSAVGMRLALRNYATADGVFEVAVESAGIKAGMLTSLILDKASMEDAGIVRGSVRYRGSINDKHQRIFTGDLELIDVQVPAQPLVQPLRQLSGKISIDENGVDFQNLTALLVGSPASASGRWRFAEKPQLIFDFAAPNLDLAYLISQIDPESTGFYATLQAEGYVSVGKGRLKDFEFTDLRTRLILDRRTWRFPNLTLRGGGGSVSGPLAIAHKPDTLGIATAPKIQDVPMAALLRWLEITQSEITGAVDITGKFDTSGSDAPERKRNLTGAFNLRISDGTIHRMRILVQLLNVLDLSRWFTFQLPDLSKDGIRFRAITGDFRVKQGVYFTENLVVDSDDLRMTGAGKIDVAKDEVDLLVAVRPFAGVDTAINYIPLLGRGIAAVKNSFLVASFNIKGPIDDPAITPAPLGTLSEWVFGVLRIPKSLIPFAAEEKEFKAQPEEKSAAPNP